MGIILVKPTLEYAHDIIEYKNEFLKSEETMAGCGNLRSCNSAKEWIDSLNIIGNEETCPSDKVPSDTYIAVRLADNKIVGIIDFRHHINHPVLSVWGGHIGYSVRPSERRKGYAKEMLKQNLIICKNYGLDRVLITCNCNNLGSKKTILSNGGIFDKSVEVDGNTMERYWIEL